MKRILTIKQAAQLIEGLTEYRIRQMCKTGQLRCFKAGNKYLIAEEDLYETVFGRTEKEDRI
jgi:excisionase family DNA binding protein